MFVENEYRGYGIGHKLIDYFKEYCCERDVRNLKVVASFKNTNAINFYRKNGFEEFDLILTMNMEEN